MIFVVIAVAWLLVSLGLAAGWALFRAEFRPVDFPPDPDVEARRERVARAQSQIDAARGAWEPEVVDLAARRFWSSAPHPKAKEAE